MRLRTYASITLNVPSIVMASVQRESNGVRGFWQMKNHTLADSFCICGCQKIISKVEL